MFDLEKAIAKWRRQMTAEGIKTSEVLDELESHLRDEIENKIRLGEDVKDAFEAAVNMLGQPAPLRTEFAKIEAPSGNSMRFLRRFYFCSVAFVLLVNVWTLLEFDLSGWERFLGIAAVTIVSLYLAKLPYLLERLTPVAYLWLARLIKLGINLVLVWSMIAILEAEHIIDLRLGIVPTMVLWCLCAAAGLSALALVLSNGPRLRGGHGGAPPWQAVPIPKPRPTPPDVESSRGFAKMLAPNGRNLMENARAEAARLGHNYIGTEHVLLGLLQMATEQFSSLLQKLNLERDCLRMEIEAAICAVPFEAVESKVPFTPRARRALELAAKEARKLNQSGVGPEHIFLGLLLERSGVAGKVLAKLGIRVDGTRELIRKGRPSPSGI
jgi:hypothetical protein